MCLNGVDEAVVLGVLTQAQDGDGAGLDVQLPHAGFGAGVAAVPVHVHVGLAVGVGVTLQPQFCRRLLDMPWPQGPTRCFGPRSWPRLCGGQGRGQGRAEATEPLAVAASAAPPPDNASTAVANATTTEAAIDLIESHPNTSRRTRTSPYVTLTSLEVMAWDCAPPT